MTRTPGRSRHGGDRVERAATARRFTPYPAYKDSGVEWLGEIPAGWEVAPVYARYEVALGKMLDAIHPFLDGNGRSSRLLSTPRGEPADSAAGSEGIG